jgi:hypothetical protein
MPIQGQGWEFHLVRNSVQRRASDGKKRTIGRYQVFHNGAAMPGLAGVTAESHGPGDNSVAQNGKRIEPGRYPLATQAGTKYVTLNFTPNLNQAAIPRPGIELLSTGRRSEILIHPGIGFLASIGCINLATSLPHAGEAISFPGSRRRVIALIDDLKAFLGARFPTANGRRIPDAFAVVDGEPM